MSKLIIAVDGPAASGKSTVSKVVAKKLGLNYIDTGAMYRCMTLYTLQNKASQIIQEDCVEGTVCFSVHPLDYLSISENIYNF